MILNVYFSSTLAGTLTTTPNKGIIFQYDKEYLATGVPLSQSLPLRAEEYPQRECLPFFSGILPEGEVKRKISDYLHISETSTFKLLQELGGDCAGVISILAENEHPTIKSAYLPTSENYEKISEATLLEFLKNAHTRPLLKAKDEMRLSLAGAQEKLPLAYFNGDFYLPKNGAPSTHIVKPTGSGELASLAANEFICSQLAKSAKLPVQESRLLRIEDVYFFITTRYDRIQGEKGIARLHQEDMCQALGILSDHKYQNDGGPGILDIYNTIKQKTSIPLLDTRAYIQYILFNLIIGNCDAHGKNYSLLYTDNITKLAPIYDTVCTLIYPSLTNKTSMKIGRHYEMGKIKKDDLKILASDIGLKPSLIFDTYTELRERVIQGFEAIKKDHSLTGFEQTILEIENSIISRDLLNG